MFSENKPGQCPVLSSRSGICSPECHSDAECPGSQKCCAVNCGDVPTSSCVDAVEPAVPATTVPPTQQRPFYGGKNKFL